MALPSTPDQHRILIVEDNPDIAELLVIRLGVAGYATMVARTVDQALSAVFSYKPTGILLDIGLPDGDGYEVLKSVGGRPRRVTYRF